MMTPVISSCLERSEKRGGYQKSAIWRENPEVFDQRIVVDFVAYFCLKKVVKLQDIFIFNPIPGEMINFDLRICFKWVGKNHQLDNQCTSRKNVFPKDILDSGWSYDVVCSLTQIDRTPLSLYIYTYTYSHARYQI